MARSRNSKATERVSQVSVRSLVAHPATLMVAGMVAVALLANGLWNQFHDSIPIAADTKLSPTNIHLSEQPDWIKVDIKQTAFRESQLADLSLHRPDVVSHVKNAFGVISWIQSIERIQKTASGVDVEVVFRRPVAVVEVGKDQLIPIDTSAVVLDGRGFNDEDVFRYWRISIPQPITGALSTGTTWDDIRVQGAAEIARVFEAQRGQAGLFRIVNWTYPTRDRRRVKPFELWTQAGHVIIWGNPPGSEGTGEATGEAKIQAILEFVAVNGPLDKSENRYFDVRSGRVRPTTNPNVAMEPKDFIFFK